MKTGKKLFWKCSKDSNNPIAVNAGNHALFLFYPIICYNLMSYYSSVNKADLAIEPLNKALDLGFKDCDILRYDADWINTNKLASWNQKQIPLKYGFNEIFDKNFTNL